MNSRRQSITTVYIVVIIIIYIILQVHQYQYQYININISVIYIFKITFHIIKQIKSSTTFYQKLEQQIINMPKSSYPLSVRMTKRRIHHMPQHDSLAWSSSQLTYPKHTQKSNPVVCPVSNNTSDYQDCMASSSMGRQYDWATWRMYDRITTTRCKQAMTNPHATATSSVIIDTEMNKDICTAVRESEGDDYWSQSEDDGNWSQSEEDSSDESSSGIFLLDMEIAC